MSMREKFETWWMSGSYPFRVMDRLEDAGVSEEAAQEIWQASRAAIEVELPIPKEVCGPDGSYMEYFEPEQIERYIESLGLKVKP